MLEDRESQVHKAHVSSHSLDGTLPAVTAFGVMHIMEFRNMIYVSRNEQTVSNRGRCTPPAANEGALEHRRTLSKR